MSVTSVRLQPEVDRAATELADHLRRSKSWVINEAVSQYIDHHRLEQQRWQETLDSMATAARGEVLDGDAVADWLLGWGSAYERPDP
ncbi:MAG: ribbon-helix-helix protein, CopG family [Wenzhouxiangellaceae bacterium]|nr:ribbon-helix-helix protein, CopG family [Wenzhouxiangellaceae bacterium]